MTAPIVFWQMPRAWDLPNPSPFCVKLETWLRMAGLPYEAKVVTGPPRSPTRKFPYVERPDGSILVDSSQIIDVLGTEHGVDLDQGLSSRERAMGVLVQRLFEEELYFHLLYERWVDDVGWDVTGPAYFASLPAAVRLVVLPIARRHVVKQAWAQGVSRLSGAHRADKARADVAAIAEVLGSSDFMLGGRPSTVDATAYAFLSGLLFAPVPGVVPDTVRTHDTLVRYVDRMKEHYWADWVP